MSICLEIIPSLPVIPTAGELTNEIEKLIKLLESDNDCKYIWERDEIESFDVLIEYLKEESGTITERHSDSSLPLSMDDCDYGWISMGNYSAGFDFYFREPLGDRDNFLLKYMDEEISASPNANELREYFSLEAASKLKQYWMLRGSVGRSRATWLLAGITATALARMTQGIVFSDDGGGDYSRLPSDPDSFIKWFPSWCRRQ